MQPARGTRRLAVIDTRLPWKLSGFRYWENQAIYAQRPDTLFFASELHDDLFPTTVYPLAAFPAMATTEGITDVHCYFIHTALNLLGKAHLPDGRAIVGADRSINMRTVFEETGIRLHATINPGGGLQPRTPREFLSVVEDHCATTFTNTRLVEGRLSRSVFVNVAVNTSLYQVTPKFSKPRIELVFCAHNDPWKGFELVAQAFNELDDDFFLHVIGNWEDKLDLLTNPKYQFHGLLEPQAIGRVLKEADVFLSGSTQYRDIHVDGFPTTAALEGMCTGCLLISPNALNEQQLVKRDLEYLEFDGANYRTLVAQLNWVRDHRAAAARIAQAGAQAVRTACDAEFVAATKLRHILGEP